MCVCKCRVGAAGPVVQTGGKRSCRFCSRNRAGRTLPGSEKSGRPRAHAKGVTNAFSGEIAMHESH